MKHLELEGVWDCKGNLVGHYPHGVHHSHYVQENYHSIELEGRCLKVVYTWNLLLGGVCMWAKEKALDKLVNTFRTKFK